MTISLTAEQQALLTRLVTSGRYATEAEAMANALKLLEEEASLLEETRRKVMQGLAEADRGEAVAFDRSLAEHIKADGRAALAGRGNDKRT